MAKHDYKKGKNDDDKNKTKRYKTTYSKKDKTPNKSNKDSFFSKIKETIFKKKKETDRKTSVRKRKSLDDEETKVVDVKGTKNTKSSRKLKKEKKKKNRKHPKLILTLKILLILFLLMCIALAGVIAAIFFGVFGDDFEIKKEDLVISASNSKIVDVNGNVIADLSGDEKRKIITLDQMADYLPKAYIAIEDERFYEHDGVDFKRTGGAIFSKLIGKGSYGGSTITQQLVKNITKDDEASGIEGILRKIREWAKAYQVERMISKKQILELYLNILYVGGEGNLHGVELGAEYYFNKSAKDLDLAECSFLAGINSQPNYYNPYKLYSETDTEEARANRIRSKCLTVLSKMKELGYVTNDEEYNAAVAKVEAGLPFQKSEAGSGTVYSYHTDALIEQVIAQVMQEKNVTREIAENYIYGSGLTIYSTVDPSIQSTMEQEFAKTDRYQRTSGATGAKSQAGMAVIDYKKGDVLGVVGSLGTKTEARGLNRATQSYRQTGSVMKPLAVIAPGLEEKVIQASTVYDDAATAFGSYKPKNYNAFRRLVNIREFIKTSQNIPAVKIMAELTPAKSIDYLKKMGITTLYKNGESQSYNDESLPLSIGGLSRGISPLEMTVAYGSIANGGESITPTFYSKIEDSNGNVIMTPNQTRTRVISPQNAYITTSILQEPVKSGGTATYCSISGIDVAAKTGTTDDYKDRWLCGYTPYCVAACWYGYDNPEHVYYSGASTNPAGDLWDSVMTAIHKGKDGARFERPEGIVEAWVCKTTGCIASKSCAAYKEIFTSDNMPPKCEGHETQKLCKETGKLATEFCPETEEKVAGASIPKENMNLWTSLSGSATGVKAVKDTCDVHKKPEEEKKKEKENEKENKNNKKDKNNTAENNTTNTTNATNTTNKSNTSSGNTTKNENNSSKTDPKTNKTENKKSGT